jgi:hypothetical protein
VSSQRDERQVNARSKYDEEPMSLDSLNAARRLFAKLAVRTLLRDTSKPDSAGPRLHRCNGSALTAQESGPAESEREHGARSTGTS